MKRNDLGIYERHGDGWWNPDAREFASLRSVSRYRLALLRSWLDFGPAGLRVVDLGCGGGLLSIPLAAAGADVVGVDLSRASLRCAAAHGIGRCTFLHADLTATPLADGCADLVLLADVLEHVESPDAAVREAARLLAPRGVLFINTINRTLRARLLAVTVAETLRLIPPGTHDPAMFRTPEDLDIAARAAGLERRAIQGERVAVWPTLRARAIRLLPSRSLAVSYSALYHKGGAGREAVA